MEKIQPENLNNVDGKYKGFDQVCCPAKSSVNFGRGAKAVFGHSNFGASYQYRGIISAAPTT